MDEQPSVFERVNTWFRTSVSIKLFIITFLVLIMLIPANMIRNIINERQQLNETTTNDVSSNWASAQQISGPVISVPYFTTTGEGINKYTTSDVLQILPDQFSVNGSVAPQVLKRGIYKVIVYESKLHVQGNFVLDAINRLPPNSTVQWDKIFFTLGISDMRGIKDRLSININGKETAVTAGSNIPELAGSGITVPLNTVVNNSAEPLQFNFDLDLQGSNNLSFIPVGNTTDIEIHSPWNAPSFTGNFLPDERTVDENGFTAKWKILQLNRNYPQSWNSTQYFSEMHSSAFGVDLIESLDDYQKSMRSVKYAILTIALTFLVFFLSEVMKGRRVHPFQYILVGLALCLFYVLLVSLSEQLEFNTAYLISASAIVLMITFYARAVFSSLRSAVILFFILTGLYSFLFVTLQMSDYALLMGSVGLTIMLALTMYFTRNIDWYNVRKSKEE